MQLTSVMRRVTAVGALAGLALVGVMPAASAANTTAGMPKDGLELIIHKHLNAGLTAEGNGKANTTLDGKTGSKVKGVTFTIKPVTQVNSQALDITTNAGQQLLASVAKSKNGGPDWDKLTLGSEVQCEGWAANKNKNVTDVDGKIDCKNLNAGAYVVEETDASGATVDGAKVQVHKATKFLVTLPMTDPDTPTKWLSVVHAYPKNSKVGVSKTVADAGSVAGKVGEDPSTMTYTITADVPVKDNKDDDLTKFVILDQYTKGALELLNKTNPSTDYEVTLGWRNGGSGQVTQLEQGARKQFTVTPNTTAGTVKIELTNTAITGGLVKVEAQRGADGGPYTTDLQLVATLKFKVVKNPGVIKNRAGSIPNSPSVDYSECLPADSDNGFAGVGTCTNEPPVTPDIPETDFNAKVNVEKHANTESGTMLGGAKFELYKCSGSGTGLTLGGKITLVDAAGKEKSEWTTSTGSTDLGKVVIDGLQSPTKANGATGTNKQQYCLKEVQAPEGYELLSEPISFEFSSDGQTVKVVNVDKNGGFKLPVTGATALIMMVVAGLLLAGGGTALVIRRRRSEEA